MSAPLDHLDLLRRPPGLAQLGVAVYLEARYTWEKSKIGSGPSGIWPKPRWLSGLRRLWRDMERVAERARAKREREAA